MEADFAPLSPHDDRRSGEAASTASGLTAPPRATTKRPWMEAAAFPASCW
jgi:hypothetical protein